MDMQRAISLINLYGKCPNCGDDVLGKEHGHVIIDNDYFERKCKCGFKVEIKESGVK